MCRDIIFASLTEAEEERVPTRDVATQCIILIVRA